MICDAQLCLLRGDVAEAERLTHDAYELASELQTDGLYVIHGALLESVRWHQGRHAEGEELMAVAAEEEPGGEDLVQAVRDLPKDSAAAAALYDDMLPYRQESGPHDRRRYVGGMLAGGDVDG
jgi:hypothetical protein